MRKIQVAHIIPAMNLGGVEVGILRSFEILNDKFDYKIYFIKNFGKLDVGQENFIYLILKMFLSKKRPDIVITSMWWSYPIGLIAKFFGVKWIVFFHSSGFSSFPEKIFTKLAIKFADSFFYDSFKTKKILLNGSSKESFHIPYFFLDPFENLKLKKDTQFDCIWAGRNSQEKRLDLVYRILSDLKNNFPEIKICILIAGKIHPSLEKLRSDFLNTVNIYYDSHPDFVLKCFEKSKVALCLSDYEGFSMTTAEAAFSGNLIAARRVGELSSYLPSFETIWLDDTSDESIKRFTSELYFLFENKDELFERRKKTHNMSRFYLQRLSYVDSFTNAVNVILEGN